MSTTRNGVLAGGNWILDYLKIVDVYPQEDTLANILDEAICNGGSPYNLLVDLAKLGANFPLEAIGLLGDDDAGEMIRANNRKVTGVFRSRWC